MVVGNRSRQVEQQLVGTVCQSVGVGVDDERRLRQLRSPTFLKRHLRWSPAAPDGDYWRLLNPGEYKVIVWALGYLPSMRRCHVGMEPRPTICDFTLTKTPEERLKAIRAKGGKIPQDLQMRIRALRLRKLRASTKVINQRRESQRLQQEQALKTRKARTSRSLRA